MGEWFGKNTTLRYVCGTSMYAGEVVFRKFRERGVHYESVHACWLDRHNHRKFWADAIGEHNAADPVRLYRDCLSQQDLLTGIRWLHEKRAVEAAGLVDIWVWIDNPNAPPDETMQFGPEECDIAISNRGTLAEYHAKLRRFAAVLGVLKPELKAAA